MVICWAYLSGYMAACWRALAPLVDLHVLAFHNNLQITYAPYDRNLLAGLNHTYLDEERRLDADAVAATVIDLRPDVVVLCGWFHRPYARLLRHPQLRHCKFIMGMDNPWQAKIRQHLARYWLGSMLGRVDCLMVPGERSYHYARMLGLPERKIRRGYYGFDYTTWAPLLAQRQALAGGWPRRFLYLGRYIHAKAIDTLLDAYLRYRNMVPDPWPLTCCGSGPDAARVNTTPGVTNLGFKQPEDLPEVLVNHGAFVIASRFEPWGLVLCEAAAAGLPVVCTDACGASVEMVRDYYSGRIVPTDDASALARTLGWMHHHHELLPTMGQRGQALAAPYGAEAWAQRWYNLAQDLLAGE